MTQEDGATPTGGVVLVTGAASLWGQRLAARLAGRDSYRVIGLDREPLPADGPPLDFVQADVRNPALGALLASEGVRTVCHLAFQESTVPNPAAFDYNVQGTMHLLQACAGAGVAQVVLKSSTAVYGARPSNPAFLTEDAPLYGSRRYGYTRDLLEIESFCNGFRRQAPALAIAVLRFASIVGPSAGTPLTRFLSAPWAPTVLGFDPRMQVIHEDDVVAALATAVERGVSGTFNVAAEGVLPLNRIRGLSGKHVLALSQRKLARRMHWGRRSARWLDHHLPLDPDHLRYACVADLTRMARDLGFEPSYTAEEALRDFSQRRPADRCPAHPFGRGPLAPPGSAPGRDEQYLRDVVNRRWGSRDRQAQEASHDG